MGDDYFEGFDRDLAKVERGLAADIKSYSARLKVYFQKACESVRGRQNREMRASPTTGTTDVVSTSTFRRVLSRVAEIREAFVYAQQVQGMYFSAEFVVQQIGQREIKYEIGAKRAGESLGKAGVKSYGVFGSKDTHRLAMQIIPGIDRKSKKEKYLVLIQNNNAEGDVVSWKFADSIAVVEAGMKGYVQEFTRSFA